MHCGLSIITETTQLIYPPIAKAAHVSGDVILIATFAPDGSVKGTQIISGPKMLQTSSTEYVRGWRANPSPGTRSCPIVISFRSPGVQRECTKGEQPHATPGFVPFFRSDPQHVTINNDLGQTCYTVYY